MIEAITYCADVTQLQPQGLMQHDEQGALVFMGNKTPTVRTGNETISLVRAESEQQIFESGLSILAAGDIGGDAFGVLFADPEATAIYDRVYDQTPVETEEGIYTPPRRIGAFA